MAKLVSEEIFYWNLKNVYFKFLALSTRHYVTQGQQVYNILIEKYFVQNQLIIMWTKSIRTATKYCYSATVYKPKRRKNKRQSKNSLRRYDIN